MHLASEPLLKPRIQVLYFEERVREIVSTCRFTVSKAIHRPDGIAESELRAELGEEVLQSCLAIHFGFWSCRANVRLEPRAAATCSHATVWRAGSKPC